MTTVINPTDFPVAFPAAQGWHRDGRDVTLYAVQVLTAYQLLGLAAKGMTFRPVSSPVRFLNTAFDRKFSAARWQDPDNCLTAD